MGQQTKKKKKKKDRPKLLHNRGGCLKYNREQAYPLCMLIAADKYTSVTYLREHLQQVHEHKSQIGIAKICTTQGFESF